MLKRFFGKSLKKELYATKKIIVAGVKFEIKKINLMNYLDGSEVLIQKVDTYKTKGEKLAADIGQISTAKVNKHYCEIFVAGVVEPKLVFKKEDDGILVDDLFINPEMVNQLYLEILEYTYGKKKVRQLLSAQRGLSS